MLRIVLHKHTAGPRACMGKMQPNQGNDAIVHGCPGSNCMPWLGWVVLVEGMCLHPAAPIAMLARCDAPAPPHARPNVPPAGPVGVQVGEIGHVGHPGARVGRVAQAQPHERGGGFNGSGRQQRLSRGGWPARGQCMGSDHRSHNGLQGGGSQQRSA